MSAESPRPPESVLAAYGITRACVTTENYKEKKGVWYVSHNGETKVLKKLSLSPARLRFVLDAAEHLRRNGIHIPAVFTTIDGRDFVEVAGDIYILTEFIKGRNPEYDKESDRAMIMQGLASFHQASRGLRWSDRAEAHVQLGNWPEQYTRHLERIARAELTGPFGTEAARYRQHLLEIGYFALHRLERSAYADWVEEVRREGGLAHQDFAAGNLLVDRPGNLHVLDIDSLSIEIPARDLRKVLLKVMKKRPGWEHDLACSLLHAYDQVNPLSKAYYEVLAIDLIFPHLYAGLIDKYVRERAPEWSEKKFLQKLQEVVKLEKTKAEALLSRALLPCALPAVGNHNHRHRTAARKGGIAGV
ncbi:MAG: CotS family spore coat protein [Limnochordales bacterium]|nr:CotS family spore coat protein [Limnochordales bacterium]